MNYRKQILIALSVLALFVLVFSGCTKKSLKGTLKVNTPPTVEWASVGSDSLNHVNPVLFWFSKDDDGVILDRLFSVIQANRVDSLGGVDAVIQNFPPDVDWTIIHTDSATIPLIASPDTSIYIDQYIFVKVMDDDSLFSNIIYKVKARNNHRPTCYVVVPTYKIGSNDVPDPQWCLPETTSTWHGIRVGWVGKDSIDIPGIQPDFEWNIRLYGPFTDSLDSPVPPDSLRPDKIYREFHDPLDTTNVWIRDKEKHLTNLETGWYILYACNRDDAYTPAIPALGKISVYEPTWIRHPERTKQILLANHSLYAAADPWARAGSELRSVYSDSVRIFYSQMVESYLIQNGYSADDYDWADFTVGRNELQVEKSDLYNHRLVIVIDMDMINPLSDGVNKKQETPYGDYMEIGGMVWIIGRRSFDKLGSGGVFNFGPSSEHSIAYNYFDLSAAVSQNIVIYDQAEFVGAYPLIGGFPDLNVDTLRVAQTSWVTRINIIVEFDTTIVGPDTIITPDTVAWDTSAIHLYSKALMGVDYLSRMGNSETIYKFSAINPDTSAYNNFPVAVRWDRGTFKSSYFCFPLYFIKYDQAMEVSRIMLDWFFDR